MPSRRTSTLLVLLAVLALLVPSLVGGCGDSDSSTTTSVTPSTEAVTPATESPASSTDTGQTDSGEVVLEVVGPGGSESYTLDQLKSLPATEGYGGMKSSTGRITPPALQKGVLLEDLLAQVGGLPDDMAVSIIAQDGYEMTMSATQLRSGDFLTYDMVTGDEKKVDDQLQVLIGYETDGRSLNPESEGVLRLGIIGPKKDQVTDGHWWIKWVERIEVKPIEQDWSVSLLGTLTEEIDKGTFESGANAGCHGQEWTDSDGNKWSGVPLYLLVGRVDDDIVHEGPAYNRELAKSGYDVQIITADGSMATVTSEAMYYNRDLIVADKMNGEPLGEDYWPLRLVGDGVDAVDYLGQISEIRVLIPTD